MIGMNEQKLSRMAELLGISSPDKVMMYSMRFLARPLWFERKNDVIHRFGDYEDQLEKYLRGTIGNIVGFPRRRISYDDMVINRIPFSESGDVFTPLYFCLAGDPFGGYRVRLIGINDYFGHKDNFEAFIRRSDIDNNIITRLQFKHDEVKSVFDFAEFLL